MDNSAAGMGERPSAGVEGSGLQSTGASQHATGALGYISDDIGGTPHSRAALHLSRVTCLQATIYFVEPTASMRWHIKGIEPVLVVLVHLVVL